jgi:hypothetical protein
MINRHPTVLKHRRAPNQNHPKEMIMATAHSTVKARSGRNPPRKKPRTPKSANRSKTPVKDRKTPPAEAPIPDAPGRTTPGKQGPAIAERGARIHVEERLQDMIRAELFNLGKAESVLRCLWLSMDSMSTDPGTAYFPDVVEVAGDLIQRSMTDLDDLYDGRIPDPLMAVLKAE